ncbi:hypothetical protein [Curtobacterium flaccumfaciens]|uniref:hypothetical protein n=1 Tax=Curtobacterium flaccumfaciens TaxID=2035 RepID=UPI001129281B|nr:hypothetical protein [Curtobacterium flaccumfaciens]TPG05140.1 hypothetical protein EAH85_14315 [Curtobacterium flaccumfaciens]
MADYKGLPHFKNVAEFAKQQGLIYDKHNAFDRIFPKQDRIRLSAVPLPILGLTEHCLTFKPRGSTKKEAVLAVTHPYVTADTATRDAIAAYAAEVGLQMRFNEPGDRLRFAGDEVVVVFWRDEHEVEAPLRTV